MAYLEISTEEVVKFFKCGLFNMSLSDRNVLVSVSLSCYNISKRHGESPMFTLAKKNLLRNFVTTFMHEIILKV